MNRITVGIDLGTDKCCITYQDKIGRPYIIMDNNKHKISSIIGILNNGLLIGNEISKDIIYDIPIITNLKRLIGHNSSSVYAQQIAKYNNWILINSINKDDLIIQIENINYSLKELMCCLLNKLKQIIIRNIGEDFDCVLTIPANFNEGQKNIILSYCVIVGIECKALVYEPCSAALAYITYASKDQNNDLNRILVFDFGAGTLDLAIVSCATLDNEIMANIDINIGDNNLGGIDIDIKLREYILEKYPNISKSKQDQSFNFLVESIKIKLSTTDDKLSSIIENYYNQIIIINIEEYYNLLDIHFKQQIINLLNQIHQHNITLDEIDIILLIGGSSYNIWIKQLLNEYYNKEINTYKIRIKNGENQHLLDIREIGVSLGATCYGQKNKKENSLILTESLPLSIGIETINNTMCKILKKNTPIPCTNKMYFSTTEDFQTSFNIKLYQGEQNSTKDNFYLGDFIIENIKPELQGKIVLIINLSVNSDGLIIIESQIKNTEIYSKKIINRYNYNINKEQIEHNIIKYETNDVLFNNIMVEYYKLITMLNKLQYNLLDNIACKLNRETIDDILLSFWDNLIIIYKLLSESDKYKSNINQLIKFINYVKLKLNYNLNQNIILNINDKIILGRLDTLNKYISNNFQHMVSIYQHHR